MESSQTTSGQRAELVSPWMAAKQGGQCFKFYYSMYGQTIGSLAVKLDISNGKSWYIFYKSGNQDYGWKKGMGNIDLDQGLQYKVINQSKYTVKRQYWNNNNNNNTLYKKHLLCRREIIGVLATKTYCQGVSLQKRSGTQTNIDTLGKI